MNTVKQLSIVLSVGLGIGAVSANAMASNVCYSVRVQGDTGFRQEVCDGTIAGTTGQSKQLEQIKIRGMEANANMCYRVHVQGTGWSAKKCQNVAAGTVGKRIEAIEILDTSLSAEQSVYYQTHIQNYGWIPIRWDGAVGGTTGRSLRMEAIAISVNPRSPCPDANWLYTNGSLGYTYFLPSVDTYPGGAITCRSDSVFYQQTSHGGSQWPISEVSYLANGQFDLWGAGGDLWEVWLDRYNNVYDSWWFRTNGTAIHVGSVDRNWAYNNGWGTGVSMM